ncbi:hydrolase [Xanthomonas phaseoli pv. phaseoli]|uniref:alpha/beta hydrolase n=1 Tax=Xanthomonas phaseoli TaxID=1985254 RepID=UPI00053820E7|nr:alpha/beta fold hydrolase [Xanthomonas phaseoli]KGU54074.1 hydrolase [Xanthomonas phaseoli pv. phaseoli]KHF48471.1 hydrolase [Xanthomonas phaseoli pv. phaseoli]KHS06079.1 hydrolase [Xanthomonas phaseoli pv. phaseoli]KHS30375.1 hydrolase [Xanthomonas phaseoli pv. phaseoli]
MSSSIATLRRRLLRGSLAGASRLAPGPTGRYLARRFVTPAALGRRQAATIAATLTDMQRHTLRIDDIDIAVYQWGDPAQQRYVLLSHGWASYALRFAAWVPQLRALGYAVVAFDQAAHGLSGGRISYMPHFVKMLRVIGSRFGRPAAFIGHSLGAASVVFADDPVWRPARYVLIAPLLAPAASAQRQFRAFGIAPAAFAPFENWLADLTGKRFSDFDATPRLPQFDRAALIIHDRRDRETPWDEGARFASLWPGAQLFTTEGLGHNRMVDHTSVIERAMQFIGPA